MNFIRGAAIFFATLALAVSGDDIAGNWKAVVVGGVRHKTIDQATFEFNVNGSHLTGTAHIGSSYPGTAPISNGEINGNRIAFTVIGEHPSSNAPLSGRWVLDSRQSSESG